MSTCNPLEVSLSRVAMMLWKHIQIKDWILGSTFSFHIHLPLKNWVASPLARIYAEFRLKFPLAVTFQIILSSSFAKWEQGIAWISKQIFGGRIRESFPQSQPLSEARSLTFISSSSLIRGLWIIDLRGPFEVQESYQNLKVLSRPRLYLMPLLKTSIPFFIAFQVRELGREFSLLEDILL